MDGTMLAVILNTLISAVLLFAAFRMYQKNKIIKGRFKVLSKNMEPVNQQQSLRDDAGASFKEMQSCYADNRISLQANKEKWALYDLGVGTIDLANYKPAQLASSVSVLEKDLSSSREKIKDNVRSKSACTCDEEWWADGSRAEGRKITNREIKFRLRSFDNTCKAALALVDWNNINRLKTRINLSFEEINASGKYTSVYLQESYLELRLHELELKYALDQAKQQKKEEERERRQLHREAEREEKRILLAVEESKKDREFHEVLVAQELEKIKALSGEGLADMEDKIALHRQELRDLIEKESRALSLAQQTRAGYVYVISNMKSFGGEMCKIGMTRRVDPSERVKELGDASVPELFDVHAFAYSEDAPKLEKHLHEKFSDRRVNLVNSRKEFFFVPPKDVIDVIGGFKNVDLAITDGELRPEGTNATCPDCEDMETSLTMTCLTCGKPIRKVKPGPIDVGEFAPMSGEHATSQWSLEGHNEQLSQSERVLENGGKTSDEVDSLGLTEAERQAVFLHDPEDPNGWFPGKE
jgi:hypothetical protein